MTVDDLRKQLIRVYSESSWQVKILDGLVRKANERSGDNATSNAKGDKAKISLVQESGRGL